VSPLLDRLTRTRETEALRPRLAAGVPLAEVLALAQRVGCDGYELLADLDAGQVSGTVWPRAVARRLRARRPVPTAPRALPEGM
jgi:hypothetical protein